MALKKKVMTEFGVEAEYWNIGAVNEDYRGGGMEITLYGYKDQATRDSSMQPLTSGKQALSGDKYESDADRKRIYEILKSTDAWKDAEDC